MTGTERCRFCDTPLEQTFADLGVTPLANAYLAPDALPDEEPTFPLHAKVCASCFLVQLPEVASPAEIFSDYAYFSSVSESWLAHSHAFATSAIERFGLGGDSLVVEVASNDGYLLRSFVEAGIPVLGVEPAKNIAEHANRAGIPTEPNFFGAAYAKDLVARRGHADLLVGNNVLAHVPDLNDFVVGLTTALAPQGTLVMEFPHVLNLIQQVQFDTIYHEHFSYLSLLTVEAVFASHGLQVVDVQQIPTHGGSLRVHATHATDARRASPRVAEVRAMETDAGLGSLATYAQFAATVETAKASLRDFLVDAAEQGSTVAAYGAAAKGNTLLNTIGAGPSLVEYVVDRSPHKQGLLLPGSRLPIHPPERIFETKPDFVLILPWNLAGEITEQMKEVRAWGGRFVVAIPETRVLP